MEKAAKNFKPIKKSRRAFEEVVVRIKESIFEGLWEPGERLPSENELASQFSVSRHTIREALRTLEQSGFLTIKTGASGGPIVKDRISGKIKTLLFDSFMMEKISVDEFTEARLAIENTILSSAFDKAEERDIKKLQENITKAKSLLAKNEKATTENFEFHSLLARASNNEVFVILESAINSIHLNLRNRNPADLKTSKIAVKLHQEILNAIINKNREKALKLLEKDILAIRKSLQ